MPTSRRDGLPEKHRVLPGGESLAILAWQYYGDRDMWRAIADFNSIGDPFQIQPGQELLLPSVEQIWEMQERDQPDE